MINCQIPIYSSTQMHPYDKENAFMGKYYMDNLEIDHHDYQNKTDLINTWILHPILHDTGIDCKLAYWWMYNDTFDLQNNTQYQQLDNKYHVFSHKNLIIPYYIIQENCEELYNSFNKQQWKLSSDFIKFNIDVVQTFGKLNKEVLQLEYAKFGTTKGYQNYNLCTATGRPSNAYNGINLAALTPEMRTGVTPKNKQFVLFDYNSYHIYLIAQLIDFEFPTNDIHSYFQDQYKIQDRDEAKKITFRQLYGGAQPEYKHIEFFQQVEKFVTAINNKFVRNGFVETFIYNRPITANNLGRMSKYKLFNYLLQSYETERNIQVILDVNKYLYEKETTLCLYNYDGFLFDLEEDCINDLKAILQKDNFPVSVKVGNNFGEMNELL